MLGIHVERIPQRVRQLRAGLLRCTSRRRMEIRTRTPRLAAVLLAILAPAACDRDEKPKAGAAAPPAASSPAAAVPSASAPPTTSSAPAPAEEKADSIVILVGGDVNLGRGAGQKILKDPNYDPFSEIAPLLKTADLRHVNLECPLSDQGGETQSRSNHLVFTGPPGGAAVLKRAGIDVVSLANNHAWDYGKKALFETFDHLSAAGVAWAGASRKPKQQYEPTILKVKGWSIALFAVTHIWNQGAFDKHEGQHYVAWASFDHLQKRLRKARKEHDLVLMSYHGGGEYVDVPMQWTREFVRAVMATGVDAFFGHHPHVPLGVGWQGSRPIFYSLGNLVFAMHSDYPWTGTSFMARVRFEKGGKISAEACPYHILGHVPMLFEGKTKASRERMVRHHLHVTSMATGGSTIGEPGELSCMPLSPKGKSR